jgi:hypothetical protein
MFNFQIFEEVFPADTDCYYDANLCQEIGSNKKKMQGLFIEKVMKDIGIKRRERRLQLCIAYICESDAE